MDELITPFAQTNFRNQNRVFGIKADDRRRHVYIIGKTGMGKTTLLENMMYADIQAGRGIALVDPHGEFAQKVLDFVPASRLDDVVYFNPGDLDYPVAFNILEKVDTAHRHLVASGVVGVFHKLWAESWGPRLEYVLRNAILGLMEYPDSTLLSVMRILVDKEYRKKVVAEIKDPVVRSFWVDEYSKYPDKFQAEAIAPIQNKVGQFLTSPVVRNIIGQPHSSFDVREIMDKGKILIMDLSKGKIGEDNSKLLGAMMITKIQLAAMSRIDVPEDERQDFYLYVDEFQNFATESFANILSEARKYHLNLILAHQYIEQLDETVRAAIFGNVGTIIAFRVGAEDAEVLEKEFSPEFTAEDIVNLAKYNIYLKLMIDGVASRAFSATTLPPVRITEMSQRQTIIQLSRQKYASSREEVEDQIITWSQSVSAAITPSKEGGGEKFGGEMRVPKKEEREMFDARCAICGKAIQVPFRPDPKKLTYCKEHLDMIRANPDMVPSLPQLPKNKPKESLPPAAPLKKPAPAISLKEAVRTEPQSFSSGRSRNAERPKKMVDVSALKEQIKNVSSEQSRGREEKPQENSGDKKGGSLRPGERITFN